MIDDRIYEDDLSYLCINSNTSKISKSELLNFLNWLGQISNLTLSCEQRICTSYIGRYDMAQRTITFNKNSIYWAQRNGTVSGHTNV